MIGKAPTDEQLSAGASAGAADVGDLVQGLGLLRRPAGSAPFALVIAVALLGFVWLLPRPLELLLAGAIIASAIAPIVRSLERRVPRLAAILLIYLTVLLAVGVLVAVTVPALVAQARALFVGGPMFIDRGRQWVDQRGALPITVDQMAASLSSTVDGLSSVVISLPLKVLSTTTEILLVVVLSMYWLLTAPSLNQFCLSLVPPDAQKRAESLFEEVCQTMGGYVRA